MRAGRPGELHRHVALVEAASDVPAVPASVATAAADRPRSDWSLLRLSVPARLSMVALAAALLWIAVLWALQ